MASSSTPRAGFSGRFHARLVVQLAAVTDRRVSQLSLIGAYRFVALGLSYELLSMFVLIATALPARSLQVSAMVLEPVTERPALLGVAESAVAACASALVVVMGVWLQLLVEGSDHAALLPVWPG